MTPDHHPTLQNQEQWLGQTLLRLITENSGTLLVLTDQQGQIVFANFAFLKLIQLSAEQVVGTDLFDFILGITSSERLVLLQGETTEPLPPPRLFNVAGTVSMPRSCYCRFFRRNEWVVFIGEPDIDQLEAIQGELMAVNNELANLSRSLQREKKRTEQALTERKRAETEIQRLNINLEQRVAERTKELAEANTRLQELDRLKSMFIASMSHELRTPLNSVIGFTGLLLQAPTSPLGPLNEKQRDYIRRVNASGKHLLALVNEVMDISQIETGKVKPYLETFTLGKVIQEALDSIRLTCQRKGLSLTAEVPMDVTLHTDRKRLLQCLLNYLSNAVKYTEQGEIRVKASIIDKLLELAVQDTGIGIAREEQKKLFLPFSRISSPLGRRTLGAGLGLYLTAKLTSEVLNGSVAMESTPGQGSIFRLKVPITLADK